MMELKRMAQALGALAQETRLSIFRHLVTAGPEGVAAGRIADALDVPAPTLSFHLKELENAGLLTQRREGRQIFYSCDYAGMRRVLEFLQRDCCQGHPEICGPAVKRTGAARTVC
jgi:ArsR family transcriptional regulator, arsenate/arsenite/antimonite-responsive transcriptional repressor